MHLGGLSKKIDKVGSFAFLAPFCAGGSASTSTLRPTASAVAGLTPGPTPPRFATNPESVLH